VGGAAGLAAAAAVTVLALTGSANAWVAAGTAGLVVSVGFAAALRIMRAPETQVLHDAMRLLTRRR